MQAQYPHHRNSLRRNSSAINAYGRFTPAKAPLNKSDFVPKTDAEQADIQNSELSVAPTSTRETPQNLPMAQQSQQPGQSHAEAQIPEGNDADNAPAIRQEVPETTDDACNVASKRFDMQIARPQFDADLKELENLGKKTTDTVKGYHSKIQEAAIDALAKCLGFRNKYFKTDDLDVSLEFYKLLYVKATDKVFKTKPKATTEFHLISRIFRGKDNRRQASADAQILIRANKEKITEPEFPERVLREGGLDAIKRKNAAERPENRAPKKKSVIQRQAGERLRAALTAAGQADILRQKAYLAVEDLQKISRSLVPDEGEVIPVVIRREANGGITIHSFKLPESPKKSTIESTLDESTPDGASQSV
jgi:hypothetical protein